MCRAQKREMKMENKNNTHPTSEKLFGIRIEIIWIATILLAIVVAAISGLQLGEIILAIEKQYRAVNADPDPIIYKGFEIRVSSDSCCPRHLTIEDPNSNGAFISAYDFRENTDPNDIYFQAINARRIPRGHPLSEFMSFDKIEDAYAFWRTQHQSPNQD